MYLAPIRTSDFSRNRLDPKNARKRTLAALEKFRKAQEALEKTCQELGIPVPEMVCRAAQKAEVPESLLHRVTIELGLLNVKTRAVNAELLIDLRKVLTDLFEKNMMAEWRGFDPYVNIANLNNIPTIDIYLGGKRIITLQ